jgi:hypothetical protein
MLILTCSKRKKQLAAVEYFGFDDRVTKKSRSRQVDGACNIQPITCRNYAPATSMCTVTWPGGSEIMDSLTFLSAFHETSAGAVSQRGPKRGLLQCYFAVYERCGWLGDKTSAVTEGPSWFHCWPSVRSRGLHWGRIRPPLQLCDDTPDPAPAPWLQSTMLPVPEIFQQQNICLSLR